jgi:glucokinase
MPSILAGDIGGTNTRLAHFDDDLRMLRQNVFKNADHQSLPEIVNTFLRLAVAPEAHPQRACFGVAGPVNNGAVTLTNLNWTLTQQGLQRSLNIPRVGIINDLRAHAEGIHLLTPDALISVSGSPATTSGNRAIIAAGTGLGEAGLIWDEPSQHHHAVACEGGHCDFAPQTEQEFALLRWLREHNLPTSWEAVLSGPGLRNIHSFLTNADHTLSPRQIYEAAMSRSDPTASAAIDLFIAFYGAEAGNLALKFLATGGVYIGGGIAPQIAEKIRESSAFRTRFIAKGPKNIQALLQSIPVFIIKSDVNALFGAASYAKRFL